MVELGRYSQRAGYTVLAGLLSGQVALGNMRQQAFSVDTDYRMRDEAPVEEPMVRKSALSVTDIVKVLSSARRRLFDHKLPLREPEKWQRIAWAYIHPSELERRVRVEVKGVEVIEGKLELTDGPIEPKGQPLYVVPEHAYAEVLGEIARVRERAEYLDAYRVQAAFFYVHHASVRDTLSHVQRGLYALMREDAMREAQQRGGDVITIAPEAREFDLQTIAVTASDGSPVPKINVFLFATTWEFFKGKP